MIRRFPSLYLLVFVTIGILLADRWNVSPYLSLSLAAIALAGAIWFWRCYRVAVAIVLLGVSFATISAFYFSLRLTPSGPNHLARIISEPTLCQVYGQVSDWPELKPGRTEIVIALDSLQMVRSTVAVSRPTDGALLLKVTDTTTALQRGDRVSFVARLYPVMSRDQGGFDYGRFLNLKGIFAQAFLPTLLNVQVDKRPAIGYLAVVDGVRTWIRSVLEKQLSPTGSALARGFLIGETRDIPPDIYGMFRDSGTLHLLAVSGSNVALVLLFFIWVMRPFWLKPGVRAFVLLTIIILFAGLSYGDPSVMRASIMAGLVLGARQLGRSYDLNNIVAVTALIILLVDPTQLFDVGFQLSFITAWGLIFAVPPLAAQFKRYDDRLWYRGLLLPFIVVLVAQVCSTPIIAYYFDRIPIVSLFANLIIVPLVSIAVLGILILLIAHLIWPLLGAFVGSLVNLLLVGVVGLLTLMGGEQIPILETGSLVEGGIGQILCLVAYIVIVLLVWSFQNRVARRMLVWVLLIIINTSLVWAAFVSPRGDQASIECHSIPGGLAVIVRTNDQARPDLIITGLTKRDYAVDEKIIIPLLHERDVDALNGVFVLSADFDVLDDLLRVCRAFQARSLYVPKKMSPSLIDAWNDADLADIILDINYFTGQNTGIDRPGYDLSDDMIRVTFAHTRVDVVNQLSSSHFQPVADTSSALLIIGSRWTPAAHDWIRLHQIGYHQIICARFEQPESDLWPDSELDPDNAPPDYLIDLYRTGYARLKLPF